MPNGHVVEDGEAVAPVVMPHAELGMARDGFKLFGLRAKTKIVTANGTGSGVIGPAHLTLAAAIGSVEPIVQAPEQTVDTKLLIALCKTAQDFFTNIGNPISIRIGQEPDVWRSRHQQTI